MRPITRFPFVMLNVQRWGTGLGSLKSGQADYYRDCGRAAVGDYHNVVCSQQHSGNGR